MATAVTATEAYPFTASALSETVWSKIIPWFGCLSGVCGIGLELEVYADSTGRKVKVHSGSAWLDSRYGEWATDNMELDIAAAPGAGNVRRDRIVLQIDYSAQTFRVVAKTGTAGTIASNPSPPALTNTGAPGAGVKELSLAVVQVDAGVVSLAASSVTDERTYARSRTGAHPGVIFQTKHTAGYAGALVLAGQAVSRITYWELFALWGTTFGAGDGTTTFNVPDVRGEVLATADNMGTGDAGRLGSSALTVHIGAASVTLTEAQIPAHDHSTVAHAHGMNHDHPSYTVPAMVSISEPGGTISVKMSNLTNGTMTIDVPAYTGNTDLQAPFTENAGGGGSHENRQATGVVYTWAWARPR